MQEFEKEIKDCLEPLFQQPYTETMLCAMAIILAGEIINIIKKGIFKQ